MKLYVFCLITLTTLFVNLVTAQSNGQFHPAISPVLRSTTTATIDYLIQDPGEVVNLAGNLFVGVIDTASKAILYDTTYYNDNCLFGGNAYLKIEEHPKGGYLVAGYLNECERDQAIITWLNDTLKEISSYLTPTGFQGTFPQFVNFAIDEPNEKIYALKEYTVPLFSDGTRPVLLYTFSDSLELLRIDTVVKDQIGDPPSDFSVTEGILALAYGTRDPSYKGHVLFYDLDDYSVSWDSTFQGIDYAADVLCKPNGVFVLEGIRNSFLFRPQSNIIREYSYQGIPQNQITIEGPHSWVTLGNFVRTEGDMNCLIYETVNYEFANGDSSTYYRSECLIFDNALRVKNELYLDWGKQYIDDFSGYNFLPPTVRRIDDNYIYYNQILTRDTNTAPVNYLNRIRLDYVLANEELEYEDRAHFHIQPNPAQDHLQLSYIRPEEISAIEILNLQGQLLEKIISEGSVPISHLSPGTYIIIARDKNGEILQRNLFIHI